MYVFVGNFAREVHSNCRDCNGNGEFFDERNRCDICSGKKTIEDKKEVVVHIDKG